MMYGYIINKGNNMFRNKSLKVKIAELESETDSLMRERHILKKEVEDLKLKKKIETEDIKHMIKIREEKQAIEKVKYEIKCDREKEKDVAIVKDEYRDKLEKRLELEVTNMKGMYSEILKRLPNVSYEMTKKVK